MNPTHSTGAGDASPLGHDHDARFDTFADAVRRNFARLSDVALFETDAPEGAPREDRPGLFAAFLAALPPEEVKPHSCACCRDFVNRFGGLVVIEADGRTTPAMWVDDAAVMAVDIPPLYRSAVVVLARAVRRAKVVGVFRSSETTWGRPQTGPWRHFAVVPPARLVHKDRTKTAGQRAAEVREDRATLARGLADFDPAILGRAVALLSTDAAFRSDRVLGVARWLSEVQEARGRLRGDARENLLWRYAATAPPGWCHVRSTMVGTLLEDLAAGVGDAEALAKFGAKMDPLKYQRPQAAPSAGSVAAAERLVEQLGLAPSLARRFARLDEVEAVWRPAAPQAPAARPGGVFSHLLPTREEVAALSVPPTRLTWEKFARTVLPDAAEVEVVLPDPGPYYALVTAADPSAPPIVQWDREGARNPTTWYTYHSGSSAAAWNLPRGTGPGYGRAKVAAVCLFPHQWGPGPHPTHVGDGVLFALEGARDLRYSSGAGLFPEHVRSELHGVRSVIEAHSKAAVIAGKDEASACGLGLRKGGVWATTVVVRPRSGPAVAYLLDRWD